MFTHRDGDIEMSDNTSYGTTHHIYATSTDESQYEDINKLWVHGHVQLTIVLQLLTNDNDYHKTLVEYGFNS